MSRTAVTGSTNVEILSSEIRDRHKTQHTRQHTHDFQIFIYDPHLLYSVHHVPSHAAMFMFDSCGTKAQAFLADAMHARPITHIHVAWQCSRHQRHIAPSEHRSIRAKGNAALMAC